ncbi:competence type IV pilus minor pilin ComGF [Heyndrickxia acidicola]|uniref:Competence type IV pilus minor pilin ComGF n=1 Tax=Heyndrickxia acidicola TaxID=209389 RepID=A0ABU6MME7_9BACI|nr:competence type IV pilus minor pilin ComGF [Heyndrickxia acidicola]MED1205146.1 competence type IV pilus minor pilin ComGF [Heyndrickxia acidicola]
MKIFKNVWKQVSNQDGFTLVESILTMMTAAMILSFYPLIIQAFKQMDRAFAPEENYEWNLFVIEMRQEIMYSTDYIAGKSQLKLTVKGAEVSYEQYANSIRRRVENTGHEVVLQKVDTVSFLPDSAGFNVLVTFQDGREREAHIAICAFEPSSSPIGKTIEKAGSSIEK